MKIPELWIEPIQGYNPWKNADEFKFEPETANRVCSFFEKNFKHSKGEFAGKNFELQKWQKQILGHLFGWKRKDGTRRYRKAFIYVPRKNGKTTLISAIGLLMLVADSEPGAEIYSAAADTEQASLVFKEASSMVRQNSAFNETIRIYDGYKAMKFEVTQSYWKVLSSEAGTKHGLNPHCYIIDEVHAQRNSELMEVLETGTGARRQPLGIYITTADYARPSPCNTMLDYARKVRDGLIDDATFFPVIYEALISDDWKNIETWKRVNPNYGISIKADYLEAQFKKALEEPSYENTFKRLHLNMQTEQEKRWMKMEDWDGSGIPLKKEELKGKKCFAGIDLSSTSDITALALYFPEFYAALCWFWVPEKTAQKKLEYDIWKSQGYVNLTTGNVINYEEIRETVLVLAKEYKIQSIGYDPWNASQMAVKLADNDGLKMVEFRQGFASMNEPSKEFEKLVIQKKLIHFGNPVLRWMASNAQVKEDPAGNIKPVKASKDSPQKIDGIVALVMAVGLSISDKPQDDSVFGKNDEDFDKILKEVYGK